MSDHTHRGGDMSESEGPEGMILEHDCGPDGGDAAFFDELDPIFRRYPDAARKYFIRCVDHETEILRIDFSKMEGLARIEGNHVITEFRARGDEIATPDTICCQWEHSGQMGGGTWTCTQRWH
jgi:hypothetical protein